MKTSTSQRTFINVEFDGNLIFRNVRSQNVNEWKEQMMQNVNASLQVYFKFDSKHVLNEN